MEDAQIVSLYWERQESALEETQRKYGSYLLKIAYNILSSREDSREAVNDTYLAAWNSIPPHRPQALSAYLAKLTRHIAIDCLRYSSRDRRAPSQYTLSLSELEECLSAGDTTQEAVNVKLLADAIGIYLRLLPRESRTLFLCRYYFLDSLNDAAAHCGMSQARAKTLLYRTRQGLRDYLVKEGFDL